MSIYGGKFMFWLKPRGGANPDAAEFIYAEIIIVIVFVKFTFPLLSFLRLPSEDSFKKKTLSSEVE